MERRDSTPGAPHLPKSCSQQGPKLLAEGAALSAAGWRLVGYCEKTASSLQEATPVCQSLEGSVPLCSRASELRWKGPIRPIDV